MDTSMLNLSIVIPVRNETFLELMLSQLVTRLEANVCDVIVVDASDEGREYLPSDAILAAFSDCHVLFRVIRSEPGRGLQMNTGAKLCMGDAILFLHSDTHLYSGAISRVIDCLDSGAKVGAFYLKFDQPGLYFRLIEWAANWRARLTRIPFGDQGIFMRSELFEQLGGYPEIPILEDLILMKTIKQKGIRVSYISPPLITSSRRYKTHGKYRTTWRNIKLQLRYKLFGLPTGCL